MYYGPSNKPFYLKICRKMHPRLILSLGKYSSWRQKFFVYFVLCAKILMSFSFKTQNTKRLVTRSIQNIYNCFRFCMSLSWFGNIHEISRMSKLSHFSTISKEEILTLKFICLVNLSSFMSNIFRKLYL